MALEMIGGSLKHGAHFDAPGDFYNPKTDLANCAIPIGVATARHLCEPANRPDWCVEVLRAGAVAEETFQAALIAFADGLVRTMTNATVDMAAEMEASGFNRVSSLVRLVILARYGQECLNRGIASMRSREIVGVVKKGELDAEQFVRLVHDNMRRMGI